MSTTDANGATTTRTYDAANRPLTALSSRAGQSETVTWTYDSTVVGAYGKGRLASTSDPSGSTTYQYDRRGLLRREQKTIEGNTYTTTFGYDANGNRSSIIYPSGRTVAYTFDHADRPLSATNNGAPLASGVTYLPFGPLTQLTHGNGTTVTRSYDSRYRLLTNRLAGTSGTLAQHDYTHDASGNVLTINDATDASFNRTFGYDDLQRLITANSGAGLWSTGSYAYDRMGNLTSSVLDGMARAFSYSGTTPKLTSVGANGALRNVTYDAAGNEITVGAEALAHSPRNHVASTPGLGLTFDGRGVRTITVGNSGGLTVVGLTVPDNSAGDVITGTVTLSAAAPVGGALVGLSSDHQKIATVPVTVTVPAGSTSATFQIITQRPEVASVSTIIRATHQTSAAAATLNVARLPLLTAFTITPSTVVDGGTATGTVTLDIAGTAATTVTVTASHPYATAPAFVVIPSGSTSATFAIATNTPPSDNFVVTFTATYRRALQATLAITLPVPELATLTIVPASVVGDRMNPTGQLVLTRTASVGGAIVTLSSSNPAVAAVPGSITIPAGSSSANFVVTTTTVAATTPVTITGVYGTTRSAVVDVSTCTGWTPAAAAFGTETVWFDDALPSGAVAAGIWNWDTAYKASGTQSHTEPVSGAFHQHYFTNAAPMVIGDNDTLVNYVMLDPCNPPQELMLQWYDGSWEHRAYWGQRLSCSGEGVGCRNMGAIPPLGQWLRLEVLAGRVGLTNRSVTGMAFTLTGGRAWFDRSGKAVCPMPADQPPAAFPAGDTVWVEDSIPPGSRYDVNPWTWDTTRKASGTQSHTDPSIPGMHLHDFKNANPPLVAATGEKLFAYVFLSPCDPPETVMLEWTTTTVYTRAYWGANLLNRGTNGTPDRLPMGALPPLGQWVRLEVPAASLGIEGQPIVSMTFTLHGGKAWFDRAGKAPVTSGALESTPNTVIAAAPVSAPPAAFATSLTGQPPTRKPVTRRMVEWWRRARGRDETGKPVPVSLAVTTVFAQVGGNAARRYSFYTPELQLMSETAYSTAATPTIATDYVWFGGEPLAQISNTNEVAYYHNDHLGAPLLQTNITGAVIWRVERDPYGERYATRVGGDRHQPLGLPGQEYDPQSPERQYNIFRWYRAGWGRYTQSDPAWDPKRVREIDPYGYAQGNPAGLTDPLGLRVDLRCRAVGAGGGLSMGDIAGLVGLKHCYLVVSCDGVDGIRPTIVSYLGENVGVEIASNYLSMGSSRNPDVQNARNGSYDSYPVTDGDTPCCKTERCIAGVAREMDQMGDPLAGNYSAFWGPNSNSIARRLIRQCGGGMPQPKGTTGWW